jgi:hypothetical protein
MIANGASAILISNNMKRIPTLMQSNRHWNATCKNLKQAYTTKTKKTQGKAHEKAICLTCSAEFAHGGSGNK